MPHEENPSKRQLDLGHQPCQSLSRPALISVSATDTTTTATTKTTTTEGSLGLGISLDSELDKRKRVNVPCSQASVNDDGEAASHFEPPAPPIGITESLSPRPLPLLTIPVNAGLENMNNRVVNTLVPAKVEILLPILSESDTQLPENRVEQEPRSVSTDGYIASGGNIPSQPMIENGHRSPPAFEAVGSPLVFQSHLDDPPLEPNWNPYDELETRTRPEESTYRSNLACRVEAIAGGSSFIPSEKPFDGGLTALEWSSGSNTGTSLLPPLDGIHPEPQYPQHYQEHYSQLGPGLQSWSPTLSHSHGGQVARSSRSKRVRKSTATPPNMTMMSVLSPVDAGHDQECYFGPSQPYQSIQQPSYHQHHPHHRQHPLDSYPYPDPSRRLHRHHDSYNQMHLGQSNGNPGHMYSGSSSQLGYMPSTHLSLSDAASAAVAADMNGHDLGYTSYTTLSTTTAYPSIFGSSEGGSSSSYSTNYQDQHQQGGQTHHQLSCHSNHDLSYSDHYALALSQPLGMVSENLSLSSKNCEYPRRNLSKQELQAMDPDPKYCFNCHTRATPSWRRCPEGRILLCNACGLYQKLHGKPRPFFTAKDGTIKIHRTQVEHDPCHLCGVTSTPIWRKGPQEENLCNACNLLMKQPQQQQQQQQHTQGQRQKSTDRHYTHQHQHLHSEVLSEVVLSPSTPSPTTWQMHASTGGGHGDYASEVSDSMGSTVDSLSVVRFDEGETFSTTTEDATRPALGNNSRRLRAASRNSNSPAPNRSRSTRSMTK